MKTYKELDLFKEARVLIKMIYQKTGSFPSGEQFGLVSQMRRSAVSVISNVAECCGRQYKKDTIQFLYISRGFLYELEAQTIVANDLEFIDEQTLTVFNESIERCKRLLNGFINYQKTLLK